jgi:hypothetical protein
MSNTFPASPIHGSEKPQTFILLSDVFSMFHKSGKPELLAKKGERVSLVSEHGEILIVEDRGSHKFSINKKLIYG